MKRKIICLILSVILPLSFVAAGEFDSERMPDVELKNRDVLVYSWSEYYTPSENSWEKFRFVDYYGGTVDTIVSSGGYYENLYKLISAGEIPDAAVAEATSFPALLMRGLVQPWDEYIDFSDPIWEETGALEDIEKMRWSDGHIYNITGRSHVLGVLFYNKRLIEDAGLDDPAELQADGEWDWDTFFYYLEELTEDSDGDGRTDVYGIVNTGDFPIAVFCSTGETPIEYDGKTFYNNLKSSTQKDAADFLYKMMKSNPRVISTGDPTTTFQQGKAAFIYTNDYRGYTDFSKMWDTDGLGIVPFPQYRDDVPQYQASLVDYFYLMKGAENPEGAALLITAQRYDAKYNISPEAETSEETLELSFIERGFTQEAAEMITFINAMPHKIIWSRSITVPDGNIEYRAMVTPWATLRDTMSGKVDSAIKSAMTAISK